MKTEFKYIHFVKIDQKPKTSIWSCRNNRSSEELGIVGWHPDGVEETYFIVKGRGEIITSNEMLNSVDFVEEGDAVLIEDEESHWIRPLRGNLEFIVVCCPPWKPEFMIMEEEDISEMCVVGNREVK